jgi:hypothetical protein
MPRLLVQRIWVAGVLFNSVEDCALEVAREATNDANKTKTADWLIRFARILPDSKLASHVKTAKNLSKTARQFRMLAKPNGTIYTPPRSYVGAAKVT